MNDYLSLSQAAPQLGISKAALHKRLQRQFKRKAPLATDLAAHKDADGEWRIRLRQQDIPAPPASVVGPGATMEAALIAALQAHIVTLEQSLRRSWDANDKLSEQLNTVSLPTASRVSGEH